jgi:hypothetical protein
VPDGWPFANVFSVGDVLIVVGIGWLAHVWCRREPASELPIPDVPEHEAVRRRDASGG